MFVETKREGEADLGNIKVARILALADMIEHSDHFDMRKWPEDLDCKTPCCIGGHCQLMFGERQGRRNDMEVGEVLGLNREQTALLFFPELRDGPRYETINKEYAVRVLRHLAATGKIDWSV